MYSDIITLGLSVLGIIFLLTVFILRLTVWQSEKITVVLPLYYEKDKIDSSVYRIYSLFEFLGLHKKCTIVIVNYGASEDFYNELIDYYKNYSFVKIVDSCDLQDKLF